MKYRWIIILIMLCVSLSKESWAQQDKRYYQVGDTLDLMLDQVQNHSESTIRIPAEGKKLTLIEIWGVACKACIEAMPRHQRMQHRYNKDIQVVLLCADSLRQLNNAKKRIDNIRDVQLPIITAESGLHKKFQYRMYGTFVWVDALGVIRHITQGTHKARGSIDRFIAGDELSFPEKTELKLDAERPVRDNIRDYLLDKETISLFMAEKDPTYYFAGGIRRSTDTKTGNIIRLYSYDTDVVGVMKYVFQMPLLHKDQVVFEVGNRRDVIPDYPGVGDNRFVFDLNVHRNAPSEKTMQYLQQEVEWRFQVKAGIVKRDTRCLVLTRFKDVDLAGKSAELINKLDMNYHLQMRNVPWRLFVLNMQRGTYAVEPPPLPIIDETGVSGDMKVDLSFYLRYDDLDLMNRSLEPFGLRMEETVRNLDVLLVKDRNNEKGAI
ncbi:DUF3738 domain-containing protein [Sphingobacterium alkalisoli]|nr:DUF3738 domain-containing protein [Sphingobacterium alkalisoli]